MSISDTFSETPRCLLVNPGHASTGVPSSRSLIAVSDDRASRAKPARTSFDSGQARFGKDGIFEIGARKV